MRFLPFAGAVAALAALGLAVAPRVIAHGAPDAIAAVLAGGVFTIALAVYIRE